MELEIVSRLSARKTALWRRLLEENGLAPQEDWDRICLLWEGDVLAATGARREDLLKYIAVSPAYQGQDLTARILTALRQDAFEAGHRELFLYTKPKNKLMFSSLFFYPIAQTGDVLFMEDRPEGISRFLHGLPAPKTTGQIGAIVMNANPFTKGHRYLVETAAGECDHVYVFVLSEDKSRFSAKDRFAMVEAGTRDLPNVTVLPTGPYLISSATFPTYFLKDRETATQVQCALDIAVFLRHFVPHFGITRRYVGTEPLSPMTNAYNEALRARLPAHGVELRELHRLADGTAPISASRLRKALDEGDWETVGSLVPETTLERLTGTGYTGK